MRNNNPHGKEVGMMEYLLKFFSADRNVRKEMPSGRRAAPQHIQQQYKDDAEKKRERKRNRYAYTDGVSGWYNG